MKIASFADLHFRGSDLNAAVEQLAEGLSICKDRDVDLVLIAGDPFDKANVCDQHASTGAIAGALMRTFQDFSFWPDDTPIIMLPGNHDRSGAGSEDALRLLDVFPSVEVAHGPTWAECGERVGASVYCLPWVYGANPTDLLPSPAEILAQPGPRILLAHVQVMGARMNGSRTCDGGSFAIARETLGALPFDRFILGDFHGRQDLFDGRGGYVGALRQLNHGEAGNPAGFEIWDSDNPAAGTFDGDGGSVEWIELDRAPRYRTVVLAPGEAIPRAADGEILRVRCDGWQPTHADAALAESGGRVAIEAMVDAQERVSRGIEVPAGALDRPEDLFRIWAASQDPAIDGEALGQLLSELRDLRADVAIVSAAQDTEAVA